MTTITTDEAERLAAETRLWAGASTELLQVIESNECNADYGSLATSRFRRLVNEIAANRAALRSLSAERDALLSDWRETAAIVATDEPEVGNLWEVVGEAVGAANANREYFRHEIEAHNATKAERDALAAECARMREGIAKALAEIEDAGPKALKYAAQELQAALGARAS